VNREHLGEESGASTGEGMNDYLGEMRALKAMGFENEALNLILLRQFEGSIDRVVDILGK
jgi:hypothetical protein